jgi:hypothetical protein
MSALAVALSIILSEIQVKVGWLTLLTALGAIIACYAIVLWVIGVRVTSVILEVGESLRQAFEQAAESRELRWLVTSSRLIEIEGSKHVPDVWLISSDLAEDCVGGPFQGVVSAKLKGGTRYRYFVPDRPEIRARVAQLQVVNKNTERLAVTYLSNEFFFLVPDFDLAIYDPFNETRGREAYLGIPVREAAKHYHAEVGADFVDVMIGKLMPLVAGGQQHSAT